MMAVYLETGVSGEGPTILQSRGPLNVDVETNSLYTYYGSPNINQGIPSANVNALNSNDLSKKK